ncbi:Linoleate 10R-lipoxygenase [Penicillium ucsense]|uniref:Linoleate 10R-lipoxygenase n=1 Tax=Penicillium ucsense TaxID=2839758 RepID=A0A8J8WLI3_9EURO|nr:Linoleate 10R-lipoxygenase [Penicillium ucsense]KAF7733913.1 Linoleate 10R-lipoxygenase [Penicillium ucsense]
MLRRFSTQFKKNKEPNGDAESPKSSKDNGKRNSKPAQPLRKSSSHEDKPQTVNRAEVVAIFDKYAQAIHASSEPLPSQGGDGAILKHEQSSGLFNDIKSLGFRDLSTVKDLIKSKASGELVDDKTYLMERIIQLVADMPGHSKNRTELTNQFLNELWDSLPHPPLSYMGDDFKYRSADGSRNNPTLPQLGAANTPYCRTIPPLTIQPSGLPDAGLLFDTLFARQKFTPHPNKVSSIFFDWASLIIHDIFQTDYRQQHLNKTSSYLDLAILYGDVQEQQDLIRSHQDGKLKPDCFSEGRLQALPAACGVLLVMLNRFHNHVVEQLALINENGRFTKPRDGLPEEEAKKAWAKRDEDLFQTGRLITCGLYINITLYDYLRTIVNLNRTNSTWCLDPRAQMEKTGATPSGLGNQCSVEFNLAYRWHSTIAQGDEKWIEQIYFDLMGKPAEEVSMHELLMGMKKVEGGLDPDPSKRTFARLERQADGRFKDEELVAILSNACEDVASSFGPRNVPKALRSIEILGIEAARRWHVGSLNEFRKHFGLKTYDTFEEINSDPEIANCLRHLYEHPDFVELYPGIVSEEPKEPMIPGVGIAPTFTISRAVLSDAVALVRGDRHYTIDYNARNLTNWGYNECRYDLNINQGCVFYKLATRAFPNWYKSDSIYAHYPMTIPSENRNIMKNLGREQDYSWDRPSFTPPRINVSSYKNALLVLGNTADFKPAWSGAMTELFGRGEFGAQQREAMTTSFASENFATLVKNFYEEATLRLIKEKGASLGGINQVDITRDVGNLAHVHFASALFGLPLKTEENSRGLFTEHEMYMILATIYSALFYDVDPAKSYSLNKAASAVSQQLGSVVESTVKADTQSSLFSGLMNSFRPHDNALREHGTASLRRVKDLGMSASQITWSHIMPTIVGMVPSQGQVFTQIVEYYTSPEGQHHWAEISRLARLDSKESDDLLHRYCLEAIRINGTFGEYREVQRPVILEEDGVVINAQPGNKIFASFVQANHDPSIFPEPNEVNLTRPLTSYIHHGQGPANGLGQETAKLALVSMLRVVARLPNLRRAAGAQGQLKKIPQEGGHYVYLRQDGTTYFPFPMSLKLHWDGDFDFHPLNATKKH